MIKDEVKANGSLSITVLDENGGVKEFYTHNLIVTSGKALVASRLKDNTAGAISHVGVGTGTTAASASDTALQNQLVRVGITSAGIVTTNVTNDSVQFSCELPPGTATGAITEAGLFNASVGGAMLSRTVFPVVNKSALDSILISWTIVFT